MYIWTGEEFSTQFTGKVGRPLTFIYASYAIF